MNIQAHRTEYQDVEGLRRLYHRESEASASGIVDASQLSSLPIGST
jgi:hypothetical protein